MQSAQSHPADPDKPVGARLAAALMLGTFCLCCMLRLLDFAHGSFVPPGADIPLTGYDSYAWLAGADRVNQYSDSLLAVLLRFLRGATGLTLEQIGYWLPAFIAPLVVVPLCLLAFWWRLPEAAPAAALLAGCSTGFLARTWPGIFDTDMLTLLFPVLIAACLCMSFEPLMRAPWCRLPAPGPKKIYLQALGIGLLIRAFLQFYPSGRITVLAVLACALLPLFLFARRGQRFNAGAAAALLVIAGTCLWHGLIGACILSAFIALRPGVLAARKIRLVFAGLLVLIFFSSVDSLWLIRDSISDLARYGRFAVKAQSIMLPPTIETVQEAQTASLPRAVAMLTGSPVLLIAGICGFLYLLWRRPIAFAFAPLLGLGLGCTLFGSRFAMYGGAALGAGLGFGSALALRSLRLQPAYRWLAQAALFFLVLWVTMQQIQRIRPELIIAKDYTRALQSLRGSAAPDAQIWEWWDLGYAAQYYSRRMTFADGSRNTGEYLMPLARVYGASSTRYAARLMAFTACRQKAAGEIDRRGATVPIFENPFLTMLHELPPAQSQSLLQDMGDREECLCAAEQYFVVSWDTIRIAKAVSMFATWDLTAQRAAAGSIFQVSGSIAFDLPGGRITIDGKPYATAGMALLGRGAAQVFMNPAHAQNPFIIGNTITREMFGIDAALFNSRMVQMLIGDPKSFEPWFTIVADALPWVRIYRLNYNSLE